ncbi:MAG TPA: DinB family protein [Actinomycetota bacterium]|nr:DinB family protein [Actinomycetota bacterium]
MSASAEQRMANTRAGLVRLHGVLEGLGDADLAVAPDVGWSVAATLAHLSFYDDWVAERWRRWLAARRFQDLPDDITELVNASGERGWATADGTRARAAALAAADAVARLIEELPPAALEDAIRTGRDRMIDRSPHWNAHLDEIEAIVGR